MGRTEHQVGGENPGEEEKPREGRKPKKREKTRLERRKLGW